MLPFKVLMMAFILCLSACAPASEKGLDVVRVKFIFLAFQDANVRVMINDEVVVNKKMNIKMEELGISDSAYIDVFVGNSRISVSSNGREIFDDNIYVSADAKIIYINPTTAPFVVVSESEVLLLD